MPISTHFSCTTHTPPQVSELLQEVGELQDVKEVTHAAISSLEHTLARIERAESQQQRRGGVSGSGGAAASGPGVASVAASPRRVSGAGTEVALSR